MRHANHEIPLVLLLLIGQSSLVPRLFCPAFLSRRALKKAGQKSLGARLSRSQSPLPNCFNIEESLQWRLGIRLLLSAHTVVHVDSYAYHHRLSTAQKSVFEGVAQEALSECVRSLQFACDSIGKSKKVGVTEGTQLGLSER